MDLQPAFWWWWVAAAVFGIVEMTTATFFFLWGAMGAVATGAVVLAFPGMTWQGQLLVFAVASLFAVAVWYVKFRRRPEAETSLLNRRGEQLVGRTGKLRGPLANGRGHMALDDTSWPVRGPDLPAGAMVRVTAVDGTMLEVEPVAHGG